MKQLRMQLVQFWKRKAGWVDSRSLSERGLLFAAIVALLVLVLNQIFLHAASVKTTALTKQMIADQAATRKLRIETEKLARQVVVDPDADNKARLKLLAIEEATVQASISRQSKDLVAPDQMNNLLGQILARQGNLQLVSLTKLPILSVNTGMPGGPASKSVTAVSVPAKPGTSTVVVPASNVVYKHGVEVVVQGGYPELMRYVTQLENLPQRVVWGNLKLRVDTFPKSTMSLTMYTLSLEKKWLNI